MTWRCNRTAGAVFLCFCRAAKVFMFLFLNAVCRSPRLAPSSIRCPPTSNGRASKGHPVGLELIATPFGPGLGKEGTGGLGRSGANERRRVRLVRQTQGSGDANCFLCNLAKALGRRLPTTTASDSSTTPIWLVSDFAVVVCERLLFRRGSASFTSPPPPSAVDTRGQRAPAGPTTAGFAYRAQSVAPCWLTQPHHSRIEPSHLVARQAPRSHALRRPCYTIPPYIYHPRGPACRN